VIGPDPWYAVYLAEEGAATVVAAINAGRSYCQHVLISVHPWQAHAACVLVDEGGCG